MQTFTDYREARVAYDAAPGPMILRCNMPGREYLVFNTNEITRSLVYDERAKFERQLDGSFKRTR
jgi:hypothetical protein